VPGIEHKRPRVAFVTLGCPKNEVDSDRMAASLGGSFLLVPEIDDADVVVVNTCSFIRDATEESVSTVLELAAEWKALAPGRVLVVAGCMPSRYGDELAEAMPEADAFVPVADESSLRGVLAMLTGTLPGEDVTAERLKPGPSAYLQVADWCHLKCTYCTIPSIRGPYVSRPLYDLVGEARLLIAGGAKEIILIGQDISSWGRDLPGDEGLADLVRELAHVEGLRWLRLMYVQPDAITPELAGDAALPPLVAMIALRAATSGLPTKRGSQLGRFAVTGSLFVGVTKGLVMSPGLISTGWWSNLAYTNASSF